MGRSRWRAWALVAIATLAYAALMFIWFSLAAFLSPITDELALSGTEAGILVGAVPLTYIPLALLTGLLVDRTGPGRVIGAGALCYGVGQVARSFAAAFPSMLLGTLLIGVGATTITFGLPKLVAISFPADRTGAPSALYLLGASAGSATVFAVGRPILEPLFGDWRAVFLWSGLLACAYGIGWLALSVALGIDRGVGDDGTTGLERMFGDLRTVLTHRDLRLVVVIGTMYLLCNHGLQGWLPTLLEARGMASGTAGRTTSLFVVSLAVGTLTIPTVADRYEARRTALMTCGAIIAAGVGLVAFFDLGLPVLLAVIVTGIGIGGISPMLRAIPPALEGLGAKLTGTAVGFIFAVGEIGGFLGPFLFGGLYDLTGGFLAGLLMVGCAGIVIVLASVAIRGV